MVDAVVSYVLKKVEDYLIQEAVFLLEVRNEVKSLKNELEWMQCFIKDAEEKQVENAIIRKWVSDIRDIAYDAEDVLDKFMLKIHGETPSNTFKFDEEEEEAVSDTTNTLQVNAGETSNTTNTFQVNEGRTSKNRSGFFASIKICSCIFNKKSSQNESGLKFESSGHKLESINKESVRKESSHSKLSLYSKGKETVNLHNIGKEIEALRKRINDLSRKRELYCLQDISQMQQGGKSSGYGRLKELRRAPSFVVEGNVIGFEDDANSLLAKLLEKEQRRFVISIFGMGGLGKTTLAKKLYHNIDIRNKFDRCAWVSVSQEYRTRDLLIRIIESFKVVTMTEEIEKLNEENLERYLHKSLEGYSYLVVIDDVWHKEAWESLRRAFPDNNNGSRVIITTRIKEVAERSDEKIHVYELRFLRPDESWKLFCDKAFRSLNTDEGLENLGREMVGKCGGLPLAIVVLGGLLSAKKPREWRMVRDHIWRLLRNDSIHISYLLALSFNDLSYQLKLCFLYLGLFPEDFEICAEKLTQLWVAEGFIEKNEDQSMEEVAIDNLNELINRSLIKIEKKCWGRVITCRVHDLLRDLAIEKAKQLNFIHICDAHKYSSCSSITVTSRRQAIYSGSKSWFWLQLYNPLSHSLLFFQQVENKSLKITQHLASTCSIFRLLRILDIEGSQSNDTVPKSRGFPKEIEELTQLRYLGLTNGYIYVFPPSIVKLKRLQTLRLQGFEWFFDGLPTEIGKLQELRHLIGNFRGSLPIDNLTNLQTLKNIEYGSWSKINPVKLVNLRELRIISGKPNEKAISLDSVTTLQSLRILSVWLRPNQSFTSLKPLGHSPCLVDLRLTGKLEKLPIDMDKLLPNLECLKLSGSLLKDDPMASLKKLPNLMILVLSFNSYTGRKLTCSAKGFPRLEIMQLDLEELEEWQVDEDAMPMLRGLKMVENSKLRIPERLKSIPLSGEWECEDGRIPINNSSYIQV